MTPTVNDLMKSPLNFRGLLDEMPLGITIVDLDFRIVLVNRVFEALTGFSASDARGIPCCHIIRSRHCSGNCPATSATGNIRHPVCFESDIINRDRQKLPVRITLAPLLNSNGEQSGYIETVEDIRAIKQSDVRKSKAYSFSDIVGRCTQMEKIFQTIPILAQSDTSILITGETGTGKDLVAEAIHQTSTRAAGPFIKINCGALPETLLESEIFGHQKGAFTGAVENKPGRFQLAHNGTIFLTEIGDLPLALQVKLLTFLDDKVIYPLGSTKGFNANVRMIAATHRNLETMVRDGQFRQDLFFRLNVARIHLPPLREREGDIRLLLDHFLNTFSKQLNRRKSHFSKDALNILIHYGYTGNIRELRNIVEYAVNMAGDHLIEPENLPAYLFDSPMKLPVRGEDYHQQERDNKENRQLSGTNYTEREDPSLSYDKGETMHYSSATQTPLFNQKSNTGASWADREREMILDALLKAKGRKQVASEILGWGRTTLWRKMKQYEIE
ncbi:Sigma54 specific transcriptional regulator, Fis family [Desulfamplus magnetovallimortis]|uniref:Sigma54 specific transcriptional regulator, Fis family n=1 Tax=Desulfamplus magnetovallimortis TaxID=1246637 RepID=A0A1W1HFL5_9BACT|nr:sigma 54-interacting transcriptional regulator [Desulfamplus magnetovallimortis]SLM31223.1 Sigma54 specific transcriptional regulator, Fis family [Desulfamplus magnetovallimortis]